MTKNLISIKNKSIDHFKSLETCHVKLKTWILKKTFLKKLKSELDYECLFFISPFGEKCSRVSYTGNFFSRGFFSRQGRRAKRMREITLSLRDYELFINKYHKPCMIAELSFRKKWYRYLGINAARQA